MRSSAPQEVRCETQEEAVGSSRSLYARAHASLFQEEETRRYGAMGEAVGRRYGCMCVLLVLRKKKEPLTSLRTRKQKYRDPMKENFSKNRSLIKM
ncbi:hypothetical protein NDU88_002142 [Pleurodeles waltl]|uniref:Uncharacterized protein n=1 Tax=Pleurodeles waltl TaxID=8319 RepID=A0AAV7W219_PLEWA|nr:hypothetical protein NDU88_002142 [Pleurodeles waltl]